MHHWGLFFYVFVFSTDNSDDNDLGDMIIGMIMIINCFYGMLYQLKLGNITSNKVHCWNFSFAVSQYWTWVNLNPWNEGITMPLCHILDKITEWNVTIFK